MIDLQEVLTPQPVGLAFDIDGTLSPIVPTPDQARLFPGVAELLSEARKYAHIAILTGRAIESGAALVNVEGLIYIGTHGVEWSQGLPAHNQIQIAPEALSSMEPARQLLDYAEQKLGHIPGVLIERKRIGGALHYRLAENAEQTRQLLLETLQEPARQHNLRLSEGKRVLEIKPAAIIHKGLALRRFVEQFGLKSIIFAGDDRTDLDAIVEIEHLRETGIQGLAIAVQASDTFPALLEHADLIVQGVEEMTQLLSKIVEQLRRREATS
ncbi:MAG TPA: trehalose-phosphatase [Ktedonobacteraceae bacterium]|nr:trehalose-phosphatase [Ktedonobacteraceae bacterium]